MRTKKAFLNIVLSLIYQIILIVSGLIVPRLILERYGSDCNGIISSATQFLGVISFLTIGLTGATRVELYKSLAKNDNKKTSQIMNSTKKYMHNVSFVLVIYTLVLSLVYPHIVNTELPAWLVILLVLVVGIGTFFEYFLGIPYRILLQADQKNYIEYSLSIISCIVYTILSVILINAKCSLVIVKFVSAIITLTTMIIICIYAKRYYHLKWDNSAPILELPQRKDAAIHSIANIIHQNSDLVILTLFTDIKIVSVYTVYYFVVGQIKKIIGSFTEGMESAFGNMWANKEKDAFAEKFYIYDYLVNSIVVIIFSCVWVLLLPFISLYTQNVTDIEYVIPSVAILITITEAIYCIRQPYATIVQAAGKYKETKNIAVIEACVNLGISLALVSALGLNGVVLGTLSANLIRTIYYMYFSNKYLLNNKIYLIINRVCWFVFTFITIVIIEHNLLKLICISTWKCWILSGFLMVCVSSIILIISSSLFERKALLGVSKTMINLIIKK